MTDKQQMEKFATDLCKACRKSLKTCECKTPCVKAEWVSEALYNAGYRKVDQDYAELLYEYERVSEGLVDAMELVHKIKAKRDALEQQLAETRKETAKEILQALGESFAHFEYKPNISKKAKWVAVEDLYKQADLLVCTLSNAILGELAKQYGLEVADNGN